MKRAMILLVFIIALKTSVWGQENIVVNYKNNVCQKVDSINFIGVEKPDFNFEGWLYRTGKVSIDSGALSKVILYKDGSKIITSADSIQNIKIKTEYKEFVYESLSNLKIEDDDFTKNAIFLLRKIDGKVKLYSYVGSKTFGNIAQENNQYTYFTYDTFRDTCLKFFKNKPKIWKSIKRMNRYNKLDYNSLIHYIEFLNSDFCFKRMKSDFVSNRVFIKEFIRILKENDEYKLKVFCDRLFFDEKFYEYFRYFNQFHYGMPTKKKEEYNEIKNNYYEYIVKFKRSLEKNDGLKNIKLASVEISKPYALSKSMDIYVQNVFFRINVGESTNETINISLGKVISIKGIKKTITYPKVL